MQGVQAGHGKVQGKVNLGVRGIDVNLRIVPDQLVGVEGTSRNMVLDELVVPLDGFDSQKAETEDQG